MLGSKLKQTRESRQLSLPEIEWATKIRAEFLQALEDERYDVLPSATHARGFLRSYARYLELDADPLVEEYNHAATAASEIVSTRPAVRARTRNVAVTPGMIVGAALLILIGIFGFYLKSQFDKYQASRAADSQPAPQRGLSDLPTPPVLAPSPAAVPSAAPSAPAAGVVATVRVDADTWLQVFVDGNSKPTADTSRVIPAGTTLSYTAKQSVEVFTGKSAHTFVTVNGKDQGQVPAGSGGTGNKTYTRGA